jgi:dihydrolipoamide dehydrogenase
MGSNRGLIRLYSDRDTGRLLGAAVVGPRVGHLAHLLAWSVQQGHAVEQMRGMPFYRPVIEEALQDALKETARRFAAAPPARAA